MRGGGKGRQLKLFFSSLLSFTSCPRLQSPPQFGDGKRVGRKRGRRGEEKEWVVAGGGEREAVIKDKGGKIR